MSNPIRTIEKSLYEKNRIVLINLKVKSENYEFLLDTGSSDCIIHTKYKDLFITPNEKPVDFDEFPPFSYDDRLRNRCSGRPAPSPKPVRWG